MDVIEKNPEFSRLIPAITRPVPVTSWITIFLFCHYLVIYSFGPYCTVILCINCSMRYIKYFSRICGYLTMGNSKLCRSILLGCNDLPQLLFRCYSCV